MSKKSLFLLFVALVLIFAPMGGVVANSNPQVAADGVVAEFETVEEALNWLADRGREVGGEAESKNSVENMLMSSNCSPALIQRNPAHNQDLDQNSSEVILFNAYWCAERNEIELQFGSDWYGSGGKSAHFWGLIVLRDVSSDVLITAIAFDLTGTPDVDMKAIQGLVSRQFNLCRGAVRAEFEGDIQMAGSTGIATKTLSTVFTPECGKITVTKGGQYVVGSVFEILDVSSGISKLVSRHVVDRYDLQQDGKAVFVFDKLAGPVSAGNPNYLVQERVDLLPKYVWVKDSSGREVWPVWQISLDAAHQVESVALNNVSYKIFLPIVFKGGDTSVVEPVCPTDVIDIKINNSLYRADDDLSTTGFVNSLRTLHPNEVIEISMTRLLAKGYTPQTVQLWLDNMQYATYPPGQGVYTFRTTISQYDERNYVLGAYRMYIFHVQVPVGNTMCLYKLLMYIDP